MPDVTPPPDSASPGAPYQASPTLPLVLLGIDLVVLIISGIGPYDRFTWFLEVVPFLIVAPILLATWKRFPLTWLLYVLIAVHAIILMVGGHYTYARVPLGEWMRHVFHFARNDYDRIGHFAQGFVPAIAVREVLLRTSPLGRGKWLSFLTVCVCLAGSACYEFFEWWTSVATGTAATAFLGTQGDPWDTQSDMFACLVGAILAVMLLSRLHDRALRRLGAKAG